MAVPVGCWPNANAANSSRPRAFFSFFPGLIFYFFPLEERKKGGPMRPHAPGFPAGAPATTTSFDFLTTNLAFVVGPKTAGREVPCAEEFPRSSGSKGKCSDHQALTKHLTNNSPCCSDSIDGSYLLGLVALSHGIIPVGLHRW
jgi:hypothetical protein